MRKTNVLLPDFKLRRKDGLASIVRLLGTGLINYHRIIVEGAEHLPAQGAGLLLPKHHAYRDIFVEGISLYRHTGRYATFVMKRGLWGLLENFGGLRVTRPKDVRKVKDREKRRAAIQHAREANRDMQGYLSWLYEHGELVISHPEGMRYQGHMGPVQKEVVEHLLNTQEERGLRVPIIPIGIEYESYTKPLSRVYFRVGQPVYAESRSELNDVVDHLTADVCRLSGLV
jgi:1-acyl-sn-glycerol-3-phosphate acyltransferase